MASCMECIHFNPCNSHGKIIVEKPTEGNDWSLHNNVENECKHFTSTADVEEKKDCEKCIYFGKHATEYPCSHCRNCYTDKFQPNDTRTPKERGGSSE